MSEGIGVSVPTGASSTDAPEIGVGMLGYAFMGKAHSNAYATIAPMTGPPPLQPRLVVLAGRSADKAAGAAARYGFERHTTDWRDVVADDAVWLFDNCGPNDIHSEASIAAAEAGKHVLCEKPLARNAPESFETWERVERSGVKHMCGFNYRFVPAVRLARELIQAGEIGEITHFRGAYLQDWGATDAAIWRFHKESAGSGALGDLAAHVIDLARYLVGEISTVAALTATFRPGREVDDAVEVAVGFEPGAVGTIEATRFATSRKNAFRWEVNGTKGSIAFDLERLNELEVSTPPADGFRRLLVTEPDHPFMGWWWPPGHIIGWEHTFVHEIRHLLGAIADDGPVGPHGATFEDGYRAAEVCDAILESAAGGRRVQLEYRELS